jgi:hypothetical protein
VGDGGGVRAIAVPVPDRLAASAVRAMAVGRYSGGNGVAAVFEAGAAQPTRNPRRAASRIKFRFIQDDSSTSPASLN